MGIAPASFVAPRTDTSEAGLRQAILDDLVENGLRRRAIAGEIAERRPDLAAYRCDLVSPEVNEVAAARFGDGDAADEAIAATIAWYGERAMLWWVGPDSTPVDLSARLDRARISFIDTIPGMAMDLATLASGSDAAGPAELRVEPVLDAAGIEAFHDVLAHGFPEDFVDVPTTSAITAASARTAAETGYREPIGVPTRWVGWVGDRPVTTTRIHAGAGVAGVYAVVTVDEARRRGYGEAITRTALAAARDAGLRIATLQASDAGRGVYERIGFRELVRYRLHEWSPPVPR